MLALFILICFSEKKFEYKIENNNNKNNIELEEKLN